MHPILFRILAQLLSTLVKQLRQRLLLPLHTVTYILRSNCKSNFFNGSTANYSHLYNHPHLTSIECEDADWCAVVSVTESIICPIAKALKDCPSKCSFYLPKTHNCVLDLGKCLYSEQLCNIISIILERRETIYD